MKLMIELNEDTNAVELKSDKNIRVDDLMTVLFTVQLAMLNTATPAPDDETYESIRSLLYDNYNVGASTVLSMYAPDKELRPDLTTEAMLEAENAYMRKAVEKHDSEQHTVS